MKLQIAIEVSEYWNDPIMWHSFIQCEHEAGRPVLIVKNGVLVGELCPLL